jgi:hypothetical protein
MQIIKGNIWDYWPANRAKNIYNPVCIPTNGIVMKMDGDSVKGLVMGAGVARDALINCLGIDIFFGQMVELYGNKPFYHEPSKLISFPTKHHWKDKADINLITQSAEIIKKIKNFYEFRHIYSVWPGIGFGGLNKKIVKPVLESIWDSDSFIIVEL